MLTKIPPSLPSSSSHPFFFLPQKTLIPNFSHSPFFFFISSHFIFLKNRTILSSTHTNTILDHHCHHSCHNQRCTTAHRPFGYGQLLAAVYDIPTIFAIFHLLSEQNVYIFSIKFRSGHESLIIHTN